MLSELNVVCNLNVSMGLNVSQNHLSLSLQKDITSCVILKAHYTLDIFAHDIAILQ